MPYLNAQLGKQGRDNYIRQIEKTGWQVCDGCDAHCSRHLRTAAPPHSHFSLEIWRLSSYEDRCCVILEQPETLSHRTRACLGFHFSLIII